MSRIACIVSLASTLTVVHACTRENSRFGRPTRDSVTSAAVSSTDVGRQAVPSRDSSHGNLRTAVSSSGFIYDSIRSQSPSLFAVEVRRPRDDARLLFVYSRTSSGFVHIGQFEMGADGLYPTVKFFTVKFSETTPSLAESVFLSFDHAAEGVVGSQAFVVRGQQLTQTFRDSAYVCRPAELKDVNRDGMAEIVRYGISLDQSDCESTCSVMLREDAGVEPAWAEVLSWNGQQWSAAGEPVSTTFYADMAQRYRAAVSYVDSLSAPACRRTAVRYQRELARWADSASALARRSRP